MCLCMYPLMHIIILVYQFMDLYVCVCPFIDLLNCLLLIFHVLKHSLTCLLFSALALKGCQKRTRCLSSVFREDKNTHVVCPSFFQDAKGGQKLQVFSVT